MSVASPPARKLEQSKAAPELEYFDAVHPVEPTTNGFLTATDNKTRTPSPLTKVTAAEAPSGSDSDWQDCDSDNERPSVKFRTPSRLSKTTSLDESGAEVSTAPSSPGGGAAAGAGSTSPRRRPAYRMQKSKPSRRRLRDRTNDSFNLYVSSPLKRAVASVRDGESPSPMDEENSLDGPIASPSKESTVALRRKLKKIRSKSDTGVTPVPSHMFRRKPKGLGSQSVDLQEDYQVHSDTEIHANEDHSLAAIQTEGADKPRRKFGRSTSVVGDLFHTTNNDSTPGLFKRRISAFNSSVGDHSGTWQDLKNTVKAGLTRKKKEKAVPEIDYEKSTELVNELAAGAPAAIILASTFQRDEKNLKRIPVLLEQIKFTLTDISSSSGQKNRKYRIDMEYGSGPARLTWSIVKEYKDFFMLHTRLKTVSFQGIGFSVGKNKLPKFPSRHLATAKIEQQQQGNVNPVTSNLDRRFSAAETTGHNRAASLFSISSIGSTSSQNSSRRSLSMFRQNALTPSHSRVEEHRERKAKVHEELRQMMERYFKRLFQQFRFRPDANKIFQFLEISNMSIRLAPENSHRGKEGYLLIRSSSSSQGWRVSHWRPSDVTQMIHRHTNKWFMVRHSYIVCVDNIYETNILEVFLVDSAFKATVRSAGDDSDDEEKHDKGPNVHITLQLENAERKIKLVTASDRGLHQWQTSINEMKDQTIWSKKQRFDSFAPIRKNVHAQWFVDGRDYFWAVSGAIDMAKDVIYIHDWWLSPELYMRRPAEGNQEWRLDRLLKRKAEEGVKIFVIVYRNVGQTIPIDSQYTKHSLLDLHPNIYVMRSPNQLLQNTFFWAHHEKLCLVDHTVAFVGGIDLCFGRWDTPDHVLTDDAPTAFYNQPGAADVETQIWPGKDYSNPRVQDFSQLDHPYDDMYDRNKVPRMPWHDVHMMVFGQPARDLVRHFVQRWNYLLRQKRPSRATPMLLPPADFTEDEVRQMDLDGTCEVQILRSSGSWSLGLKQPEHSIQNAYLKAIEQSEHFVYIENQFFISSTTVEATKIENRIGDALVERIIRAHENGDNWRAVVVIPLMPGFESQVDMPNGSSVRVIMQCQYMTISRGPNSIFGRLEKAGINPEDYIQFFSLRKWGKIGPNKKVVTEQLYIHAKTMIVDDRVAIIGSANINERSMRGNRDSECAAIVRDAHQIDSTMAGKPFKVGRFAHTLRMRLMREHMGLDVDQIDFIERQTQGLMRAKQHGVFEAPTTTVSNQPTESIELRSFNHFAGIDNVGLREKKAYSSDNRVQGNARHKQDVDGNGIDGWSKMAQESLRAPVQNGVSENTQHVVEEILSQENVDNLENFKRTVYERTTNHRHQSSASSLQNGDAASEGDGESTMNRDESTSEAPLPPGHTQIDPFAFKDPLDDTFYYDTWLKIAEKNTATFRQVFRCQPDDHVTTWKEYMEYSKFGSLFSTNQDKEAGDWPQDDRQVRDEQHKTELAHAPLGNMEQERGQSEETSTSEQQQVDSTEGATPESNGSSAHQRQRAQSASTANLASPNMNSGGGTGSGTGASKQQSRRRSRANTRYSSRRFSAHDQPYASKEAEEILHRGVQGHLVMFPTEWLSRELDSGNWVYNLDRIPPLEIYD